MPRPYLNYLLTENILAHNPGSYRSSTPGTRNWATMSICTVLSPAADLLLTTGSVDPPLSFLSLSGYSGISSRGNIFLSWTPVTKRGNLFFHPPAVLCRIPASGRCSKTAFMRKTGVHISKKPSTVSGMRSNTWDGIPIGSPSPTTGSCP